MYSLKIINTRSYNDVVQNIIQKGEDNETGSDGNYKIHEYQQ